MYLFNDETHDLFCHFNQLNKPNICKSLLTIDETKGKIQQFSGLIIPISEAGRYVFCLSNYAHVILPNSCISKFCNDFLFKFSPAALD